VAVAIAIVQLVGLGVVVGSLVSTRRGRGVWTYAVATAAIGLVVVSLKLILGH
jgi:hypothetical protein